MHGVHVPGILIPEQVSRYVRRSISLSCFAIMLSNSVYLSSTFTSHSSITTNMSFPYKHVLLVGATSGIGASMASRLISSGVKVSAVGRRKERLEEFVSKHGEEKASSMVFDIADLEAIPSFAETYAHSLPSDPTKIDIC
jgi:hypothetical protein